MSFDRRASDARLRYPSFGLELRLSTDSEEFLADPYGEMSKALSDVAMEIRE